MVYRMRARTAAESTYPRGNAIPSAASATRNSEQREQLELTPASFVAVSAKLLYNS